MLLGEANSMAHTEDFGFRSLYFVKVNQTELSLVFPRSNGFDCHPKFFQSETRFCLPKLNDGFGAVIEETQQ